MWAIEAALRAAAGLGTSDWAVPVRGLVGRLDPLAAAAIAATQVAEGLTRLKVKLNGDLAGDAARLRAVREAAPDAAIVADANEQIDRDLLPDYTPVLRNARVAGLEQPCPRTVVLERGLPRPRAGCGSPTSRTGRSTTRSFSATAPGTSGHCIPARRVARTRRVASPRSLPTVASRPALLGSNSEFGPGAIALHRVAASLPDLPAAELLGHDHACAVDRRLDVDVLACHDGVLVPR